MRVAEKAGVRRPSRLWACGLALGWIGPLMLACSEAPEPERLRVGTSGDYSPFSLEGRGFDIEVARQLSAALGMEIEWVPFAWSELGTALRERRFDVAMSGITWQPQRAVVGWMSRAVAAGGPCWIGRVQPEPGAAPARVAVNRGNPDQPLANAEIEAKFFENCELTLSDGAARRIRDMVLDIESLASAERFEAALACPEEILP